MFTFMMIVRFAGAFLLTVATVIGGSFAWPKFTNVPRPEILEKIYTEVVKTPTGQGIEAVLGATDVITSPESLASYSGQLVASAGASIQKKAEEVVMDKVLNDLLLRFATLTDKEKDKVREAVCKTSE